MTLSVLDILLVGALNVVLLSLKGESYEPAASSDSSASVYEPPTRTSNSKELATYLLGNYPDCFIVVIFLVGLLIPVMMLWGMHVMLVCKGISTNEKIKFVQPRTRPSTRTHTQGSTRSSTHQPKQEDLCEEAERHEPVPVVCGAVRAGAVPQRAAVCGRRALRRAVHHDAGRARGPAAPTRAAARREVAAGAAGHRRCSPAAATAAAATTAATIARDKHGVKTNETEWRCASKRARAHFCLSFFFLSLLDF